MEKEFKGKTVLVTGGSGSIGSTLVREILKYQPKTVRVLDLHEYSLHQLEQSLSPEERRRTRFFLGDVRDKDRLRKAMHEVDIVYHAAAYKHVHLCEYNPMEAIKTNVMGTQNAIDAALENGVKKFVFISTDKAASPVGILGASKLLGERIVTAANYNRGSLPTIFSSVRFGNVTMSNGSVIPKFIQQIKDGENITLTAPAMTRFLMPMSKAVELILKTTEMMNGGEIFVLKMKSLSLENLAAALIEEYNFQNKENTKKIKVKNIGRRAGEKMHEHLITEEESSRVVELDDMIVVLPPIDAPFQEHSNPFLKKSKKVNHMAYTSNYKPMSKKAARAFMREHNIIEAES